MRPGSGSSRGRGRRGGNHSSSPTRERPTASGTRPSVSLSSPPLVTEEFVAEFQERPTASVTRPSSSLSSPPLVTEEFVAEFQDMQLGGLPISATQPSDFNPRSFPYSVKQKCWDKAEKVKGRDPDRWRRDPIGNLIFRKLVGCPGCLCHDYDHIVPYSKGGKSTLENCQVLQATVNRSKGNRTDISKADLIRRSSYCRVSGRDMDLVELSAYGNVRRDQNSGGCFIQ